LEKLPPLDLDELERLRVWDINRYKKSELADLCISWIR